MRNRKYLFILVVLPFLLLNQAVSESKTGDWKLQKNEEGIKVYNRTVSGTEIKDLRATMSVHASLNSILELLKDVKEYKNWVFHCKEAHELNHPSVYEVYYYQYTSVPFPFDDRDLIIHSIWKQDEKTKAIYINGEGLPKYIPEKKGVVRITKFKSSWKIIPAGNGDVNIEYEVSTDPAGWVPTWLINLGSIDGPFETCKSIKARLKLAKYANPPQVVKEP